MDVESDKEKDETNSKEDIETLPTIKTNSYGLILKNCSYTLTLVFKNFLDSLTPNKTNTIGL